MADIKYLDKTGLGTVKSIMDNLYATKGHNHDTVYSKLGHNHNDIGSFLGIFVVVVFLNFSANIGQNNTYCNAVGIGIEVFGKP